MKKSDFMVLEKLFEMQREAYIGQLKILHKSAEMVGNCITVNPLTNRNSFDVSKQGQVNKTAVKSKLMHLVNGDLVLTSKSCVLDFICLFPGACTEDARVGLLLVLRASEKRTAFGKSLVEDFQNKKGMSILKVWLMESHDCAQDDVVKMILNVLLEIKWSMALILKSKIVDVVRRVKKDTENKSLKSSAADVLKLWKKQHSEQVMMEEKKDAEERKKKADDVLGTLLTQEAPKAKPKVVRKEIPNPVAKVIPPVKVPEKPPVTVVDNPLPTIQSFGKHTTKGTGPKIRWADEHGKPLEHIRFIQSREEQQKMGNFENAKKREHDSERGFTRSQRKTDPSKQAVQLQWYTPRKLDLPTDCPYLTKPINTQEMKTQRDRTAGTLEMVIFSHEKPPETPVEWNRSKEPPSRSNIDRIPLQSNTERAKIAAERNQRQQILSKLAPQFSKLPTFMMDYLLYDNKLFASIKVIIANKPSMSSTEFIENVNKGIYFQTNATMDHYQPYQPSRPPSNERRSSFPNNQNKRRKYEK